MDSKVVYHFMFPTFGVAVAHCPGDVVVFHPKFPHCCAQKLPGYNGTPVYLSSFYMKASHVGGINNTRELSSLEKSILNL